MSELQQGFIVTRNEGNGKTEDPFRYVKDIFDSNLNYVGTIDDFKIETEVQDDGKGA